MCRCSGLRGRRRPSAVGGRGEGRNQRSRHVPGEGRPRGRPDAVRVARVVGRHVRHAPASTVTGHRELRDDRAAEPAQRLGSGCGGR